MIKNFLDTAILTSQNPETFLTFYYDGSTQNITPSLDVSISKNTLFINGLDMYDPSNYVPGTLTLSSDASIASFYAFTPSVNDFDIKLILKSYGPTVTYGPELITSWTNGDGESAFDPFTTSGKLITEAGPPIGDGGFCFSNDIGDISIGDKFSITYSPVTNYGNISLFIGNTLAVESNVMSGMNDYNPATFTITNVVGSSHSLFITTNMYNDTFSVNTLSVKRIYTDLEMTSLISTLDISILNRPFIIGTNDINIYNPYDPLLDNEASYLLLRTNPKFSGNIKLIVDSSNNMYLDTFKVSDILSNKKYRKQRVSGNSVLSSDIRNTFNTLPIGEVYRLDSEDTLNIAVPKTNLYDQYNTTYSYGSRFLEDDLYDDEYSILAPLWINSRLPDHFVVFRLDGTYNPETYVPSQSLDDLANKYVSEGDLIKSWSLKPDQPLGTYLNTHLQELLKIRSPLFLSLGEDPNTWYGIAIDKGIITGRSEVPYFFDNTVNNFTDMNAFISEGFERNNLLCPNLVNLEYTFTDDASLYTMHRYFGLYLTDNQLYKIGYYTKDFDASTVQILSLDGNDSSVFIHSGIFDTSGNIANDFKNRIFVLNDGTQLNRITNVDQIDGTRSHIINYLNKPGDNIFSSSVTQRTLTPFVTIKLNNKLNQGEHLRVINETQNKIWEVFSTDTSLLANGECFPYDSVYDSSYHPTVYRTSFSVDGSISDQVRAIERAFDSFSSYDPTSQFRVGIRHDDSLSLMLSDDAGRDENWKFQRISSQNLTNISDPSSGFSHQEVLSDITFMGAFTPSASDFSLIEFDASYGPIGFEFFGDRNTIFVDFYDPSTLYMYNFDSSVAKEIPEHTYYQSLLDNRYKLIQPFNVVTQLTTYGLNFVADPLTLKDKYLVSTEDQINLINGKWYAYNVYPLYISLMGINPVKDMDFTVYDSSTLDFSSEYWYKRDNDDKIDQLTLNSSEYVYLEKRNSFSITSGQGNIEIDGVQKTFINPTDASPYMFNTFDGSAYVVASMDNTTITYGSLVPVMNYDSYDANTNEESIYDYYDDPSARKTLKYGLTVPYVAKWSGPGNDCRNNEFRLILKNVFDGSTSNYIPYISPDGSTFFKDEISYPSHKYLNTTGRNWKDYVYYDVNDVIEFTEDSSIKRETIKSLMFDRPLTDVFSKLLYSNNDANGTVIRSSIVFFNEYKNTLDTLINGLNLSMSVEDFAKNLFNIKSYDRFKFSFISSPSRNHDSDFPLEIIINENTGTILMVWYQGNDNLSYAYRNSSFTLGKSLLINTGVINNPGETNKDFQGFYPHGDGGIYSFVKSPFFVNNTTLTSTVINQYTVYVSFGPSTCSPYAQMNYNTRTGVGSIFNAYGQNYVNNSQNFIGTNYSYNTFDGSVNYYYKNNLNTYGPDVINNGFKYGSNDNLYIDKTCDLSIFNTFMGRNQVMYYVLRGDTIYSNRNFVVPAFNISLNQPRLYNGLLNYNGYYHPKFNNILEFNYNEDDRIIDVVKRDFILNNTNLKSYNDISQYFYNKVVTNVGSLDISLGNAIDYQTSFNVFKSQWDKDFYVLTDSSQNNTPVNGLLASKEMPNFFGSKLVKLPYTLVLDESNLGSANGNYDIGAQRVTLTYDLTQMIRDKFINNTQFISNWYGLTGYDVNSYIKNSVVDFYNIAQSKVKLNVFTKVGDGTVLSYTFDDTMTEVKQQNFDSQLSFINGDYVYSVVINNVYKNNINYFIKFTLFEI